MRERNVAAEATRKSRAVVIAACAALLLTAAGCARRVEKARAGAADAPAADAAGAIRRRDDVRAVRVSAEGTDAAEPSVAVGRDGAVYAVWVEHRPGREADVWLSRRDAEGKSASAPARVNPEAGKATAWHGDPPSVAVAEDGAVYVVWTARAAGKHASTLYLSASRDGGRSFDPPVRVNDDERPAAHGMHSLAVAPGGRVHVAWLDERNVAPPPPTPAQAGEGHKHKESNREVYFATSADGGRTFSANRRVASEVCPCCKTSLAVGDGGRVYVAWRQVLPGEFRHIAVASSADGGQTFSAPVVVSDDRWMIEGCPVSGAALSAGAGDRLRVLWYTAGEAGPHGLYWAESRDGGRTFGPRRAFAATSGRGTPVMLKDDGDGDRFAAVWEGNDGAATSPQTAAVGGDGRAAQISALAGVGELPAAVRAGRRVYVAYVVKDDDARSVWIAHATHGD